VLSRPEERFFQLRQLVFVCRDREKAEALPQSLFPIDFSCCWSLQYFIFFAQGWEKPMRAGGITVARQTTSCTLYEHPSPNNLIQERCHGQLFFPRQQDGQDGKRQQFRQSQYFLDRFDQPH
jgi:hypothetical protein